MGNQNVVYDKQSSWAEHPIVDSNVTAWTKRALDVSCPLAIGTGLGALLPLFVTGGSVPVLPTVVFAISFSLICFCGYFQQSEREKAEAYKQAMLEALEDAEYPPRLQKVSEDDDLSVVEHTFDIVFQLDLRKLFVYRKAVEEAKKRELRRRSITLHNKFCNSTYDSTGYLRKVSEYLNNTNGKYHNSGRIYN